MYYGMVTGGWLREPRRAPLRLIGMFFARWYESGTGVVGASGGMSSDLPQVSV
ncbi:hypothetical protein BKA25_004304 [Actinoalloteichus hymeniacidonis]|uniref:Uncharacterized protein n=1 Tax=Actinoalloteichus hymeniacidonis TaxID=340345 RepID=A0AAC9HMJ4_9PSEU|nr:hypothetical protein TL08_05825 [Actinoalloteichus hymeniacidonis]MBB5909988.1 hypothetical protein [Actinoalloteichus hymeniacidonis]